MNCAQFLLLNLEFIAYKIDWKG